MELEHSFVIPVPPEQAWEVLFDVERVAPCMPGATIDGVDGEVISGKIKVKVGPIALTYAGKARFTVKDEQARVVVLEASGKETRGTGTASATVRSTLQDLGGKTRVTVHTTMNITGRPAQFGRGVMVEVGGKIIEKFAANLAAQLATGGPAAQPATDSTAAQPATDSTAAQPATDSTAAQPATDSPAAQLATDDQSADAPAVSAPPTSSELAAAAAARNGSVPGEEYSGDAMGLPIEELNLPVRSYNSLRREGVHTVGALASRNEKDLLAIDGLGPQSVKEIKQRLADHGLALGEPSAPPAAAGVGNAAGAGRAAAASAATPDLSAPDHSGPDHSPRDRNGFLPPPAARPADEDSIDLLSVAGLPVLKRALPGVGILVGLLLLLGLRSRRKRRRARAAGA
jgi:carbon monoxide dehydrogenase subunit G